MNNQNRNLLQLILTIAVLVIYCLISDYLIGTAPVFKREYWALYDGVVHGLVGVLVLFPFFKNYFLSSFLMIFCLSAIIDIDHFIAAGSFSVADAISLPMRPVTHSLSFAILAGVIGSLFIKSQQFVFWIVFAAIASHVLRDASSGLTLIFYPLEVTGIPVWSYLTGEAVLACISFYLGNRWLKNEKPMKG